MSEVIAELKTEVSLQFFGINYVLPYTCNDNILLFKWTLPIGLKQSSYMFQMKTRYPVYYSDGQTYMCAYYNSGIVRSVQPKHKLASDSSGQLLDLNTWRGSCQIRITIFDEKDNQYCTHQYTDNIYDFERNNPRYRKWDSRNDNYYFCFYPIRKFLKEVGETSLIRYFIQYDILSESDVGQSVNYVVQVSETPLFAQGLNEESLIQFTNNSYRREVEFSSEIDENNPLINLQFNKMYYCRAKSFDGYDYSDWSKISVFQVVLNDMPVPQIVGVYYPKHTVYYTPDEIISNGNFVYVDQMLPVDDNTNGFYNFVRLNPINNNFESDTSTYTISQAQRQNGQLIIALRVNDNDNDYVYGSLCFSMIVDESEAIRIGCDVNDSVYPLDYASNIQGGNEYSNGKLIRLRTEQNLIKIPTVRKLKADDPSSDGIVYVTWNTKKEIYNKIGTYVYLYFCVRDQYFLTSGLIKNYNYTISKALFINNVGITETSQTINNLYWWNKGELNRPLLKMPVLPDALLKQAVALVNGFDGKNINKIVERKDLHEWRAYWKEVQKDNPVILNRITKIDADEFVSFCPYCDDTQILRTVVLYNGKEYDNLKQFYIDVFETMDKYDGSHYTLIFKCDKCHNFLPLNTKYQSHLDFNLHGINTFENNYYYHGYNYTDNIKNNKPMMEQLKLVSQREYYSMGQLYKQECGDEEVEYPLPFVQIKDLVDKKGDKFSMVDQRNSLINMKHRPDVQPYSTVHTPRTNYDSYGIYIDGADLNGAADKDYYNNTTAVGGDTDEERYYTKLSDQELWIHQNLMHYRYIDGQIQNNYKGGYTGSQNGEFSYSFNNADNTKQLNESSMNFLADMSDYANSIVIFEGGNPKSYNQAGEFKHAYLFQKTSIVLNLLFPLEITRDFNDRFSLVINNERAVSRSVLPEGEEKVTIDFPFYKSGEEWKTNENWNLLCRNNNSIIKNLLSSFYNVITDMNNRVNFQKTVVNIDAENKSLSLRFFSIQDGSLKQIEYKECDKSCYETFGFKPFSSYQTSKFFRKINVEERSHQARPEYDWNKRTVTKLYAYCENIRQRPVFDVQESPVDNTIQSSFNVLSTQSKGQPLFTCYKDEVDKNGYHFKFNEQDFKKTGKIYVRKYHIEYSNPFPMAGFGPVIDNEQKPGYRNWIVVPIDPVNKPGRYYKKKILRHRGTVALQRMIDVKLEDGSIIQEIGYFNPVNNEILSHKKEQGEQSNTSTPTAGQYQLEDDTPVHNGQQVEGDYYQKFENETWRNSMRIKSCVVFDYVPIEQAITKNYVDFVSGRNPFNHKMPISFKGLTFDQVERIINRYGVYVMGGYDLTEEQKYLIETNNQNKNYLKTFSSAVQEFDENNRVQTVWKEYQAYVPNNWRPLLLNSSFKVDKTDSSYGNTFNSLIRKMKKNKWVWETKQIANSARYKKVWQRENLVPSEFDGYELSQYTVQQFNPSFNANFNVVRKFGYEPDKCLQSYFKIDEQAVQKKDKNGNVQQNLRSLSLLGNDVHGIHKEPWIQWRILGSLVKERHIISDVTLISESLLMSGDYDKLPYLDYPIVGKIDKSRLYYFSGYPKSDDPFAYQYRPQPVYPYDRQLRIGGLNRSRYMRINDDLSYSRFKANYDPYQFMYGAYIDKPFKQLKAVSYFYYVQDSWNTFNLIHWDINLNRDQILFLYAQKYDTNNNILGPMFSVRTLTSKKYNISINGEREGIWGIPFNQDMCDYIDFHNQNFDEGGYYKFFLYEAVSNNVQELTSTTKSFQISRTAVSPVNILSVEYDPWTGKIDIIFRLDDARGFTYDIVGFKYSLSDEQDASNNYIRINSFDESAWNDLDMNKVHGQIYDLRSNKSGNSFVNNNYIITHKISINVSDLGISSSDSLRFKIYSALSIQRKGLTFPNFKFKLWANQFLKQAEERIMFLQGFKSRWVQKTVVDNENNVSKQIWQYVDESEARTVIGSIQNKIDQIDQMDDDFEKWYSKNILFSYKDLDYIENNIKKDEDQWNEFYYMYIFDKFIRSNAQYLDQYREYKESNADYHEYIINRNWLSIKTLQYQYEQFYRQVRLSYIYSYDNNGQHLVDNNNSIDIYKQVRQQYVRLNLDAFNRYMNGTYYYDDSSSSSSQSQSQQQSQTKNINDDFIIDFISNSNLGQDFISYLCTQKNMDTKFQERAWILFKKYNVNTEGLFYSYSNINTIDGFSVTFPDYCSNTLSDKYQYFLIKIGDESQVANYGKSFARINIYDQTTDENGNSYGKNYRQLMYELSSLREELNENIIIKNQFQTNHRANLIKQGFYCNGFENNEPYKENGDINTCFRWRVETRPYQGDVQSNTIYYGQEDDQSQYGYQQRFNAYIRFQLDFFGTFDSQEGDPLRDIMFTMQENTNASSEQDKFIEKRIKAGIAQADRKALTTPDAQEYKEQENWIPESIRINHVQDVNNTYEKQALQLSANFNLEKRLLPGRVYGDKLPAAWIGAQWNEKNNVLVDEYKSAYFYRIATYNVVQSPVFDSMIGKIYEYDFQRSEEDYGQGVFYNANVIFNNLFHSQSIKYSQDIENNNSIKIFLANEKLSNPVWTRNIFSSVNYNAVGINVNNVDKSKYVLYRLTKGFGSDSLLQHYDDFEQFFINSKYYGSNYPCGINFNPNLTQYNNDWINIKRLGRGQVQFLTDRPRSLQFIQEEVDEFYDFYMISLNGGQFRKYEMMQYTYTLVGDQKYPVFKYQSQQNQIDYLYYAEYQDGMSYWFFDNDISLLPKLDNSPQLNNASANNIHSDFYISGFHGQATEAVVYKGLQNSSGDWYYRSTSSRKYPIMINKKNWTDKNDGMIEIMITDEVDEDNQISFEKYTMSYIEDNIGNYNIQWIPSSPIRKKPFVLRMKDEYILFSHKIRENAYIERINQSFPCSVITLSRGSSNDIFGEQSVCFPKYSYIGINEVIQGAISFENPCVVNVNGIWRMYFNAVFNDENDFRIQIYKADTYDFQDWFDFQKINAFNSSDEAVINNYQPFVCVKEIQDYSSSSSGQEDNNLEFQLYVSHRNERNINMIDYYVSNDGINFYKQENALRFIENGMYNLTSPFVFENTINEKVYDNELNVTQQSIKIKKLYMTLTSSDNIAQIIVSTQWDYTQNKWSPVKIEKSVNQNLINRPFMGDGFVFIENASSSSESQSQGFVNENNGRIVSISHFMNPCVIMDTDGGFEVQRIYYNTYDTPYAWYEKKLILANGKKELTIHTQYLEKYEWSQRDIMEDSYQLNNIHAYIKNNNGSYDEIQAEKIQDSYYYRKQIPANNIIKISCALRVEDSSYYGIKLCIHARNQINQSLSQAPWISFDNINNTDALMTPQMLTDLSYDVNNYTPDRFIQENDLYSDYQTWLEGQESTDYDQMQMKLRYIVQSKYYPKYNWWSKKGSGIYRYLGWDIIKDYSWQGDQF